MALRYLLWEWIGGLNDWGPIQGCSKLQEKEAGKPGQSLYMTDNVSCCGRGQQTVGPVWAGDGELQLGGLVLQLLSSQLPLPCPNRPRLSTRCTEGGWVPGGGALGAVLRDQTKRQGGLKGAMTSGPRRVSCSRTLVGARTI